MILEGFWIVAPFSRSGRHLIERKLKGKIMIEFRKEKERRKENNTL